ncbi:MAG: alpha-glucosidase [Clostridia bacterium]|nr:alpha-glucosidase [Clostridia bacterium]
MVKKYVYGNPIETNAVVAQIEQEEGPVQYLSEIEMNDKIIFNYAMESDDIVYGLGEANRGMNKRGGLYRSFCSDEPYQTEEKQSLYGAHNFIVVTGMISVGFFIDCASEVKFDIGYTSYDMLNIEPGCKDFTVYVIEGKSAYDIVKQFREMIGRSYIAPKWAFGYQQSRWSYMSEDEIREVVKKHRESGIPLDAVYLDIDYMEGYKDFTVSEERFPNFPEFVKEMREQGVRLVPIIDAGVKIEEGYDIYEEGKQYQLFCKKADGSDFVAGVWPGRTHFPDFMNTNARMWFGSKYKVLIDSGIEGFWNDMNEPAMFFTEEGIQEAKEYLDDFDFNTNEPGKIFELKDKVSGLSNRMKDYQSFYHNMDGNIVRHDQVHNLYGANMTRAAGEAFDQIAPDKRLLLFSRASYIGSHRYGGIWTGDNQSWWSHLLLNIKMMPSLNMCGYLYSGADLGGFGANCTRDLLMRWLGFGIFTPLMRNHAAAGTRRQECYNLGDTEDFRSIVSIRYSLIPYLYSEYMKSCLNNDMMFKPLSFEYPADNFARTVEDQLLVGESIMIAPIYEQNAIGRYVYLPEDMLLVIFKSSSVRRYQIMKKGMHYIPAAINEVPLFVRKNKLLPLCRTTQCTDNMDTSMFEIIAYTDDNIEYLMYEDDGVSKDYDNPDNMVSFEVRDVDGILGAVSSKTIVKLSLF